MSSGEMNSNVTETDSIESIEQEYNIVYAKLRPQRQQFALAYLECLNATKAAETAKYSKKTADRQGSKLLKDDKISLCIRLSQRLLSLRSQLSQAWVLQELKVRYERCVSDGKEQAATSNLNLIGQHLGMFGKGEKDKGDLHLHQHKYVNYPPVPESIQAWVDQMKQVGYNAELPVAPVTSEGKDEVLPDNQDN